jgi:uncharacterized protein (TIGR03083 family)
MSFETGEDARRLASLLRAEYDSLLAYLQGLPPEGWTEQSAAADWRVYQVASHLGSGPRIAIGVLEAGLRGAEPMTDEQRRAVWGYFDGLQPDEMLPAFRQANADFFQLLDSLTDDELRRTVFWIGGEVPVATVFGGRLSEQTLHAWDIRWARDKEARLSPAAVPDVLEYNLRPSAVGRLAKPERAEQLVGKTIEFRHSQPAGTVSMQIRSDGVTTADGRAASPDLTVQLPSAPHTKPASSSSASRTWPLLSRRSSRVGSHTVGSASLDPMPLLLVIGGPCLA